MRCAADDRQAPRQFYRTVARPELANDRVQSNAAEQEVPKLKTPWRDGTTHLVTSPLEFLRLHIGWQLCGSQIRQCYVSNGCADAGFA